MVLNNAMEYAAEIDALTQNPLKFVKWTKPRTLTTVDPRVVINADQARRFLVAVKLPGCPELALAAGYLQSRTSSHQR
jgi:hypothetical protein